MLTATRIVVGVLLVAHGLVHLLYLAPDAKDPGYPFTLKDSWAVSENAGRPLAWALCAATVAAFALAAVTVWQIPLLTSVWPGVVIAAASASLALLVVFWDNRLIFGVVLDVALIAVAVTRPDWAAKVVG